MALDRNTHTRIDLSQARIAHELLVASQVHGKLIMNPGN